MWPILYFFFSSLTRIYEIQINSVWADTMQKFIEYFYFSCNSFFHYENTPIQIYWKFYNQKRENLNSDIFHISAQNIDYGYSLEPPHRGGSNEYPQSMFLSRNKKNNIYPCKPQFYYIKVGFEGSKLYRRVFVMYKS